MTPSTNWILGAKHGAWARPGQILGRNQISYPQIPFSSQPQFREPINQGCGKNIAISEQGVQKTW